MKKISFILLTIAFIFASCEKESKLIDVQIVDIVANDEESTIVYKVVNNSDLDINAYVRFDIDGDILIGWESDCETFPARCSLTKTYNAKGRVHSVDAKAKACEI